MKSLKRIIPVLIITVFTVLGCTKDDALPKQRSVEGVYIGTTYRLNKWANPMDGYNERDTIFADTFLVSIVAHDTIVFKNKGLEWAFESDAKNYYIEWYGSHSNREFKLNGNDSLSVKYWSYGGYGGSFNQTNTEFKGMKQ